MVKISEKVDDEILQLENMRCIGSLEACSRVFSIPQSECFPSVQPLTVHLPLEQMVFFVEGNERNAAHDAALHKTQLTEFFDFNKQNPAVNTKYCDFPQFFSGIDNGSFGENGKLKLVQLVVYFLYILLLEIVFTCVCCFIMNSVNAITF